MNRLLFVLTLIWATTGWGRDAIWIEGENAVSENFNKHGWYTGSDLALDLLSPGTPGGEEGAWLAHFERDPDAAPVEASYAFELADAGPHDIWIRANYYSPGNAFYIDAGDPQPLPVGQENEPVNLHANRENGRIDVRLVDWTHLGEFDLDAGEHTLTIRVAPTPNPAGNQPNSIGIDAIAIVNFPWGPAGTLRPDAEPVEPAADAWFPFHHGAVGAGEAETDISATVEAPTGLHGPLKRIGSDYQFEDGTPVKFWGVGTVIPSGEGNMRRQAAFLRRMGVNLVRLHTVSSVIGKPIIPADGGPPTFDPERLDRLDRYTALLREHGIYMQWSVFWKETIGAHQGYPRDLYDDLIPNCNETQFGCYDSKKTCVTIDEENAVVCDGDDDCGDGSDEMFCDGEPDVRGRRNTYGIINVSRALQDIRWQSLQALLDHTNPHTGLRYADDPTLAILEIQNEDNLFFNSPLNGLQSDPWPLHSAAFRAAWADWVRTRYQTDEALAAAWGTGRRQTDSVDAEELPIYGAWEFRAAGPEDPDVRPRMGDFMRFLVDMQTEHWTRRQGEIQSTGFGGIVLGSGWKTGGPMADAAMLAADATLDAIDRHGYFGGFGDNRVTLREFRSATLMDLDTWFAEGGGTPFHWGFQQAEDRPYGMSEWAHGGPGEFRAEAGPIYAFYGLGLQGWDQSLHFAFGAATGFSTTWDFNPTYRITNPVQLAQYPALATAVHHGHFDQGAPAAMRRLTTAQAFAGYDALTQPTDAAWDGADTLDIPAQIFAVGRIGNAIGDDVGPSERSDWTQSWDAEAKTVTANTGQLHWNYGERFFEARSPKTQGVVGFAGGQTLTLPDVTITMETDYASLLVTALDNRPISESHKVLVTAVARERWTGSDLERKDGSTIELKALGGPPMLMQPVQATLAFNAPFDSAKALNSQGQEVDRALPVEGDGSYRIDGRYTTLYYLFEREAQQQPGMGGAMGVGGAMPGAGGAMPGAGGQMAGAGGDMPPLGGGDIDDSGCGCRVSDGHNGLAGALFLGVLLALTRRRRRD